MVYTYYKKYGNRILMRYKKDGNETISTSVDTYQPTLFIASEEPTDTVSIYGNYLKPIEFEDIKSAEKFAEQYKNVENFALHGNCAFGNQFLIELFEGKQPDHVPSDIRVGIFDIEVDAEVFPDPAVCRWPVNAITMHDSITDVFTVFGLPSSKGATFLKENGVPEVRDLTLVYNEFESEEMLLRAFASYINQSNFDVTSGWNSELFDWPYIINRMYHFFGEKWTKKMLSPFGMIQSKEIVTSFGQKKQTYDIIGLPHLDYLNLYKKHTFTPRESFKLNFIGHAELGEKKIDYDEYGSLMTLYRDNYQLFIDYNIQDVNLIRRLNEKLGLFELTYALAYYTMSNYEDTLGTVRTWEHLIAKHLYSKGVAPLYHNIKSIERAYDGAFVMDPKPGLYDWVVSFDLNSLYPHIEMQYNIGPETHVAEHDLPDELIALRQNHTIEDLIDEKVDLSVLDKYDYTMAANFHFYRKDKLSFISEIKRDLYAKRKEYKKEMLGHQQSIADVKDPVQKTALESLEAKANNMQMAMKILLNGGYGALANKHFLYYMVDNAEAITSSGRLVNRWTGQRVDAFLKNAIDPDSKYWVYSDTDSGYYSLKPFVDGLNTTDTTEIVDMIDRLCKEAIGPFISSSMDDMCDYMRGYEQKMVWEREVIAEKAAWLAKKRYVMAVWDSEGVRYPDEPKMKMMGVDAVRSSTPEWSRTFLKESYRVGLLYGESRLQEYLEQVREEFYTLSLNDIAIPRGVNNLEKYSCPDNVYIKGTPKNVRGSLVHNNWKERKGLDHINPIASGDKIKYVSLKIPNPTHEDVIAFDGFLDPAFGLHEYIDYDAIYDKAFMAPMMLFLDAVGWEPEELNTLF